MIGYILTQENYDQVQGQFINPYQFINCVADIQGNYFFFGNEQDKVAFANSEFSWLFDLPQEEYIPPVPPEFPRNN